MESLPPQAKILALLLLLGLATLTDFARHRIPNWLTLSGTLLGLMLQSLEFGGSGLQSGLAGWMLGLILLLPFYLQRAMGAGDVKLMAAVGTFLGGSATPLAVGLSLVSGALLAIIWVVARRSSLVEYLSLYGFMSSRPLQAGNPASGSQPFRSERFPYAGAIATGTLWALIQQGLFDQWLRLLH